MNISRAIKRSVRQDTDTIGGRISLAREALELSDTEAAATIAVSTNTWSDWERDRCEPPPQLLQSIAENLQVTLYWLLTGRGVGPTWQDLLESPPEVSLSCWQADEGFCMPNVFLR